LQRSTTGTVANAPDSALEPVAVRLSCPDAFAFAAEVAAMSHVRLHREPWGYYWFDDCPPPHLGRKAVDQPPAHARLTVELPPCKPQGGINTDWSGNKCALREGPNQDALPTPQTRPEAPQTQQQAPPAKADAGTAGQAGGGNDASDALPAPQTRPEAPQTQQQAPPAKADAGTVAQASGGNHASTVGTIGFDVAVALGLALAFVVVRRTVLDLFGDDEREVERGDGV
jgi:hypothetical protein